MTVPIEFRGLWQREVMVAPDGTEDRTTRVFWLQTEHFYADIRVRADRPATAGRRSLADYDDAELLALARAQGFAGTFEVEGDFCRWRREFDFQPVSATPDEAHCTWSNGLLIETGIHAPYREDWRRLTPPDPPLAAFRRDLPGQVGLLVVAGDHFIALTDRSAPLPPADSLADIVARDLADGDRARAMSRFGMTIDFGRVSPPNAGRWRIDLSTQPWREGSSLLPDTSGWTLASSSLAPDLLAAHLPELL